MKPGNDSRRAPLTSCLTNYVTVGADAHAAFVARPQVVAQAKGLRFLVLDELHTYRGRQGADVAMLVRRVRTARTRPPLRRHQRHHGDGRNRR